MSKTQHCAYCGTPVAKADREHVIPSCLYPESKSKSKIQRITIPACRICNGGWSDDEAHFRNMMTLVAGEAAVSTELWRGSIRRSLDQVDGQRRLRDLYLQMKSVETDQGSRFKVYPGRDERVIRVVKKVVRGLAHFHNVETAVADDRVWADVLTFQIPEEIIGGVQLMHREPDVFEYWYEASDTGSIRSVWYMRFLKRVPFVAAIGDGPLSSTG